MILALLALSNPLELIKPRIEAFVERGRIPGAVTLVAQNGKVVKLEASGYADLEMKKPLKPDTIFQIASMTKSVTATAIMILADEGRLSLNDPVDLYIPEFKDMKMKETGRSPSTRMRIRHLLTHMSGLNGSDPSPITDESKAKMLLGDYVKTISESTLDSEPGAKINYSGRGTSVAGRIVEIVSGMPFERFVLIRILEPLSMKDTHFFLPREKHDRLAMLYFYEKDKLNKGSDDPFKTGARLANPAGGLYSTASDMFRFYQMVMDHGKGVLSRAAVETMTQVQSFPTIASSETYGFGFAVSGGSSNGPTFMPPGVFGHAGATGTYGWGDPRHGVVGIYMTQCIGGDNEVLDMFRTLVNVWARDR